MDFGTRSDLVIGAILTSLSGCGRRASQRGYGISLQQYSAEIDQCIGAHAMVTVLGMGNGVSTRWAQNEG